MKLLIIPVLLVLARCAAEDGVEVYRIPKEVPAAAGPAPATAPTAPQLAPFTTAPADPALAASGQQSGGMVVLPGMAESSSSFAQPAWTVPAGWEELSAQPPRRGYFTAPGAVEVTVTVFPGDVGGVAANVNRWRRQAGAPMLPPEEAARPSASVAYEGGIALVFEIPGTSPDGAILILGAIVDRGDHTWFFKLTGPADAAAAQREPFSALLGSLSFPASGS